MNPAEAADPLEMRRRRLLFRATHRGTHETDLLVGGFVAPALPNLTESEIAALEVVMDLPDADLADWLSGRRPIPEDHDTPMLRRLRDAALAGSARK
jgi:antitoxin CptB